jgi:hypothetical protein
MMAGVRLSVYIGEVASVLKNLCQVEWIGFANYVLVPAIAILLWHLFEAEPQLAPLGIRVSVGKGRPQTAEKCKSPRICSLPC